MTMSQPSLLARCLAEAFGTFLLVLLGCGVVHTAVLAGAQTGLWQVAVVWGAAVTLAIFTVGGISGAHINPAMTVAFAVWRRFPWRDVVPYVLAQVAGAALAALVLYGLFQAFLEDLESRKKVVRGQPGSEITAMCYGEYFPNPGPIAGTSNPYRADEHAAFNQLVSEPVAFLAEVLGTALLSVVVFSLIDERNRAAPGAGLVPVFIGLTIAVLISLIAPLTQACFNPARDFGPRVVAYFGGWGEIAIPGPRGFLTVYVLAPIVGAVLGGAVQHTFFRFHYSQAVEGSGDK